MAKLMELGWRPFGRWRWMDETLAEAFASVVPLAEGARVPE